MIYAYCRVSTKHQRIARQITNITELYPKAIIIREFYTGTTLTTKKSVECKAIIKKHSKDFGGSLEDPDVIKLCGCSRNSYYKYKRELK